MQDKIKNFIKSYTELKAKKEILDTIMRYSSDIKNKDEYSLLVIKIQIVESCLQILTSDERDIVFSHLINNLKWNEISEIYGEKFGMEFNYSERTFKRIQKSALSKIENFIYRNKFEAYIAA